MGATYYISAHGNDGNSGLSADSAWKGFSRLKERELLPGDRVLLHRGDTWNETLVINGKGTPENFIEITAYGDGEKPKIQLNGDISERCVRINNASYLRLSEIEVCHAGAGIVLFYDESYNNRSVYINNVCAHDFYGIYRASGSSSGRDEWKDYTADDRVGFSLGICVTGRETTPYNQERVLTDFRITDCEVYRTGGGIGLDWCDHRCVDGSVVSENKFGDVLIENVNLHDNDVPDVSLTSLFLQCVTGAVFRNSVIDNGAGGAPWGTAAVHLQLAKNVVIENVVIKNMPHTNVSDECGIDFETDVENCVIRNCTFENNAGSAVEFLANFEMSACAISRRVKIDGCVFVNNNYARLDEKPGQIHIKNWQHDNCPQIEISNCLYLNPAGVDFIGGDGNYELVDTRKNCQMNVFTERHQAQVG